MRQNNNLRRVQGYCALCWSKCGCISVVENNRLVAVEPDQQHPTGQALCGKGRAAPELVNHEDRLLYPLKRTRPKGEADPGWERIGWNEALDTVSSKLKEISHESGTDSVAFGIATSAGTSISDGYRWIERLRRAFGSPNAAIAMELCGYAKEMAFPYTFGVEMPVVDLEHTDCIMLWGHNPTVTWLAYGSRIAQAKDNGAKLIVVDPRHVGLASKADQWLRIQPGTDGALALGLANIIIENEWYDGEFIRNWTNGPHLIRMDTGNFLTGADLDEGNDSDHLVAWNQTTGTVILYDRLSGTYSTDFTQLALFGHFEVSGANGPISCRPAFSQYAELCNRYTPERVEQLTSIPAQQIRDTAQLFGNAQAPSFYAWSGLEMHTNVSQTNRAIALLYALTGNFDSEGGNVIFETTPLNDVFGDDLISPEMQAKSIGLADRPLGPETRGWITVENLYSAILTGQPSNVRALVNFGKNMLFSHANASRGEKALSSLEFMVHADLFMNPTAQYADIVLPVNSAWEREGLCTDFVVDQKSSSYVQLRPAVVESRGESRSDEWIAFALAERLDLGHLFWNGDTEAAYRYLLEPSGLDLDTLRHSPGGISLPSKTKYRKYALMRADGHQGFRTPSKKVEIYVERYLENGYQPLPEYVAPQPTSQKNGQHSENYPLVLTSGKSPHYLHSQLRNITTLRSKHPDPRIEIHPQTAAIRGILENEWVTVSSPHGHMRARAKFSPKLHPSVVSATHGWWQACKKLSMPGCETVGENSSNLNSIISGDTTDPIGGAIPLKSYICEIERIIES